MESENELLEAVKYALQKSLLARIKAIGDSIGVMPSAISFCLDSLKFAYAESGGAELEADDIWTSLLKFAETRFGGKWKDRLYRMGITRSEDLSIIIYSLVLSGVLNRGDLDRPSDFWGLGAIDR